MYIFRYKKTLDWCDAYVLVSKMNRKVMLNSNLVQDTVCLLIYLINDQEENGVTSH